MSADQQFLLASTVPHTCVATDEISYIAPRLAIAWAPHRVEQDRVRPGDLTANGCF